VWKTSKIAKRHPTFGLHEIRAKQYFHATRVHQPITTPDTSRGESAVCVCRFCCVLPPAFPLKADLDSPRIAVTDDFSELKAWALSLVKNSESSDICLPSFLYGGVTWTCSTLRRRLRLISGTGYRIATATSASSNGALSSSSVSSEFSRGKSLIPVPRSPLATGSMEPTD
jgi:hypothetical protein